MPSRPAMKWRTCLCCMPPFDLRFSYQVTLRLESEDVTPSFLPVVRPMDRESDGGPKIMTCEAIDSVVFRQVR
jgi:hypothetical protein